MAQKKETSKWLRELQQRSWEPEILLSGIVLYGLFKMPELLIDFRRFYQINFDNTHTDIDNFIETLKIAINWLTGGLILHLVCRGIWVGMVGISFVFPNGINVSNLNYKKKYIDNISEIPKTEAIIHNLEVVASAMFSVSFLSFMMVVGAYFYLFSTLIIPDYIVDLIFDNKRPDLIETIFDGYAVLILVFGFLSIIDFTFLGVFKKIPWISTLYYPIYRFLSFFTLAKFYRPIYFMLISNFKVWKVIVFNIAFLCCVFLSFIYGGYNDYPGENISNISLWSDKTGFSAYTGYYEDQIDDLSSMKAQIQSDIITGNTIKLFLVLNADKEDSIKKHCNYKELSKNEDTTISELRLDCLAQFYTIQIGDSTYQNLSYLFHYRSKTKQKGILTYLEVEHLPKGLHHIKVSYPKTMYRNALAADIPFYKE